MFTDTAAPLQEKSLVLMITVIGVDTAPFIGLTLGNGLGSIGTGAKQGNFHHKIWEKTLTSRPSGREFVPVSLVTHQIRTRWPVG